MDLFSHELSSRLGSNNFLVKIDKLLAWPKLTALVVLGLGRSGLGPTGYGPEVLLRCLLLGQFHSLSDPELEQGLKLRLDFLWFSKLSASGSVPDETCHCRFRNALIASGFYNKLLDEVNTQIEGHGLKLKQAEAAIIDATLIQTAARAKRSIKEIPDDRNEPAPLITDGSSAQGTETSHFSELAFSADKEARWIKKGRKSVLGYKGFARCDEQGYVDKVLVRPANEGEAPHFETMIKGTKAKRVMADKAYYSQQNKDHLKGKYRDGIMRRSFRNKPLRASQKRFNKLISKTRWRIEQCFGTAKRLFGLDRSRYFGREKTQAQMAMSAVCMNLLKAANIITLTPAPTIEAKHIEH